MGHLFKYLFKHKGSVLVIIALLVLQAYCDLALPQYTSDIVDVGLQQNGIDHIAPEEMRETTYENLCLFMTEEEIKVVDGAYSMTESGTYKRDTLNSEALEELESIMGLPMVLLSYMNESEEVDLDTLKQMVAAGAVTKEDLLASREQVEEQYGDLSESIINQMAVLFVQAEYEALGMDMNKIQTNYLWKTGGMMLGMTVVMVIAAVLVGLLASRTAASIGRDLRGEVFHKVVSFSNSEMDQFSTASLITRSTNDIQQVQMVSAILLRMVIYAPILGIGGVFKVVNTRTGLGWIVAVAVAAIMLLVAILMVVAMPKFKKMQVLLDKLNLVSREIITGLSVIRAFGREKYEEKRFEGANKDLMSTQLFTSRVMTFMMPIMMLIMNGVTVMIVWFGAQGVDLGNLQVGDMIAFITYTMQIVMAFLMLSMVSIMLPRAGVSATRIDEIIQSSPTIIDKKITKDDEHTTWSGLLTFDDVNFRFPGADEDALEHISFTAEPGKTTAIIGSTGCGKSTMIHLINRFYDVTSGSIKIDGIDIRELSQHKLHSMIGFVPQKGVLFSGDIESNIKFAGDWITDEEMKESASIAQAVDFIEDMPSQYKEHISQGGTNVSGGQKQRLSIARAIAMNPRIFLFDDSFSALDYKTDVLLRKALNEKVSEATVVIVAQRISTILHADQIIVLEEGRVAGKGTHEELLGSCSTYQEIARSQLSEKELEGGRAS